MRHILMTSMLVAAALLVVTASFAQEKQSDAGGALAASPDMWEAYRKMWEGKWETAITTPEGDKATATMTVEVILDGKAVLTSATWSFRGGSFDIKSLDTWCPKRKAIVSHSANSLGGRAEAVFTLVNGEERGSTTYFDPDGTEDSNKSVSNLTDPDAINVKFVEGRFAGAEFTWKRKKN
jgi:hypothetical protein